MIQVKVGDIFIDIRFFKGTVISCVGEYDFDGAYYVFECVYRTKDYVQTSNAIMNKDTIEYNIKSNYMREATVDEVAKILLLGKNNG